MKRLVILLAICLCVGLCACSGNSDKTTKDNTSNATNSTTETKETVALTEPIDYYALLYDYVIREGYYDSKNQVSYIYKMGSASNVDLMLIAENGTLRYWYFVQHKTSDTSFTISYECTFHKGDKCEFEFVYSYVDQYSNGVAISGETATVDGAIGVNGDSLTVSNEKYVSCNKSTIQSEIKECHKEGVTFIEEIMKDANIDCTLKQLFE